MKLDLHPDDLEIISAKLKSGFNRLHALAEGRGYYPKIKPRLMSQHVDLVRENEIESYKYNVDQRRRHKVV